MISFAFIASTPNTERDANAAENKALCLPPHRGSGRLAVVGGGPSLNDHIEELRNFDGTIWAVNGAINWCIDHGIEAWFYTIDAQSTAVWPYDMSRIKRAVLSMDCSPTMFAALRKIGAELTTVTASDGGPTSANAADWYALETGYHGGVTFFGCEGCFGKTTHAFSATSITQRVTVRVGDEKFTTKPEFLEQSRVLAGVIRTIPDFYSERSGGLLAAMVKHGMDYEITGISEDLAATLRDRTEVHGVKADPMYPSEDYEIKAAE